METFGKMLRSARMERGLTQQRMATILGVQLRTYQNYEQGLHTPTYENLVKICDTLGVTSDHLLGRTPEAPSD